MVATSACNVPNIAQSPWGQYQRDSGSSGFTLTRTAPLQEPRWRATVGPALFAGPVLGNDGRIYLAQLGEGLLALNANGDRLWLAPLTDIGDHQIMSTPAVGDDNSAYVVVTNYRQTTSRLHRVGSLGGEMWSSRIPMATTGSPKLWRDRIFISAPRHLYVFDTSDGRLLTDLLLPEACAIVGEPQMSDFLKKLAEVFTNIPIEFDKSASAPVPPKVLYPTVAILDNRNVITTDRPVIIVSQVCDVHIVEYEGERFRPLGTVRSDERRGYTSPVVTPGGAVVVGADNGDVLSLLIDVRDAPHVSLHWKTNIGQKIWFTPVATVRQIFVATHTRLLVLDSNGESMGQFTPPEPITGAPAASADHVFLGTDAGMYSLSWNLATRTLDDSIVPWFYRSPAIGRDGSVIVGGKEALVVYPGR